jgi:hypothetical protein
MAPLANCFASILTMHSSLCHCFFIGLYLWRTTFSTGSAPQLKSLHGSLINLILEAALSQRILAKLGARRSSILVGIEAAGMGIAIVFACGGIATCVCLIETGSELAGTGLATVATGDVFTNSLSLLYDGFGEIFFDLKFAMPIGYRFKLFSFDKSRLGSTYELLRLSVIGVIKHESNSSANMSIFFFTYEINIVKLSC